MPCRNSRPYLHEALTSILKQPEFLELLVAESGLNYGNLAAVSLGHDLFVGVPDPLTTAFASVLMPCRNAGPYLHAAVQSVLAQKECLELLVADGGSPIKFNN